MADTLEQLHREILDCRMCAERFGFEPHPVVFGQSGARIVQISQAPSRAVHGTRKPFDDASGKKLRGEWYRIPDQAFYNPANFFITSIARCYPGKAPKGGDRPPPAACARRWLHRELALVDNSVYILIGGHAARFFFPKTDLTELVFADLTIGGKPAYVLPHPSPLNIKWFRDNPQFLSRRVHEVARAVHGALGLAEGE